MSRYAACFPSVSTLMTPWATPLLHPNVGADVRNVDDNENDDGETGGSYRQQPA